MPVELKYGVFALYALIIIGMLGLVFWVSVKREKKINNLQSDLKNKVTSGFNLNSKDISLLGQAHDLSPKSARLALYRVYKDMDKAEDFEKLKTLVQEIQKEEPFDTMPDEVKPSLLRISELSHQSDSESDKQILTPVTNILTKYQELVEEQKKTRKQANIAYLLTIVSSILGAVSLYFAFSAPTAKEIAKQLKVLVE